MSVAPLLSIENLTGGYGEIVIVTGLSLSLSQGQVLCVTGRNGVGKSTLVRLVTGALRPASGRVVFEGADLTFAPAHGRARQGMGYAPQEGVVFDTLSVAENLTLHHRDRSLDRYHDLFAMFPRLPDRLGQRAGTLSGGEKKILSFCRALAEDTRLVILDEPTEGVQPENIALMAEAINRGKGCRPRLPDRGAESEPGRGGGGSGCPDASRRVHLHPFGHGQSSRGTVAAAADLNRDWQIEKPAPSERTRPVSFPLR
jgi:ABC-type branched-subunit amino acid transport system ATPase component